MARNGYFHHSGSGLQVIYATTAIWTALYSLLLLNETPFAMYGWIGAALIFIASVGVFDIAANGSAAESARPRVHDHAVAEPEARSTPSSQWTFIETEQ